MSRIPGVGSDREYGAMPDNRRLVRVREGRILAGVCTGLGRYTRIDPVIFRVGLAVLTLGAGGSGVFLYIAAILLTPSDEESLSVAEHLFKRRFDGDAVLAMLGALLTAGVAISVLGRGFDAGRASGPLTAVTVFALALLVAHSRGVNLVQVARTFPERFQGTPIKRDEPPPAAATAARLDPAAMVDLATLGRPVHGATERSTEPDGMRDTDPTRPLTKPLTMPLSEPVTEQVPPESTPSESVPVHGAADRAAPAGYGPVPRGGSGLTSLTLLTALGAGTATVPLTADHPVATRVSIALAAGLAVLGAGLIIASWYGRSRGLVFSGVVLCLALVATSAVGELPGDGRWGDVHWRPISARADQSYRVIVGEGNLDLTALPLGNGQRVRVRAEVSFGEMRVTVPGTVTTEVHARSTLGDVNVAGRVTSGPRARVDVVLPADGKVDKRTPVIELYLRGRVGDVEVRRVTP